MSLEWLAILLVFALLLLWFLGPRIIIDETVQSVQLPKDLNTAILLSKLMSAFIVKPYVWYT